MVIGVNRAASFRSTGWVMVMALLAGCSAITTSSAAGAHPGTDAPPTSVAGPGRDRAPASTMNPTAPSTSEPRVSSHGPEPTVPSFDCGRSRVFVVGDSLTRGAVRPGQFEALMSYVGYTARVDAMTSRFIRTGVQILRDEAAAGRLEPVVMVALGTNDAHAAFSNAKVSSLVDQVMDAVGPERVVLWVNVQLEPSERADHFNARLLAKSMQYTNLIVLDWASTPNTQYLAKDGVHYSPTGYRHRAFFMAEHLLGVTHCARTAS